MRLIVAASAALMLAAAAHATDVAVFTGKSRMVFFPYWKLGIECEYLWRKKTFLMIYFGKSSCPKVYGFKTSGGKDGAGKTNGERVR